MLHIGSQLNNEAHLVLLKIIFESQYVSSFLFLFEINIRRLLS